MATFIRVKNKKSIPFSEEEMKLLKGFMKKYKFQAQAAEALGISTQVLGRIKMVKSASPEIYTKIKSVIIPE